MLAATNLLPHETLRNGALQVIEIMVGHESSADSWLGATCFVLPPDLLAPCQKRCGCSTVLTDLMNHTPSSADSWAAGI